MQLDLTTPALLFPAISLLLLAYTQRFLTLANLIRNLHSKYKESKDRTILGQLKNLRLRVILIRNMQALGVLSLLFCVLCMFLLFAEEIIIGRIVFGMSLILLIISLGFSVYEIQISIKALELHLSDMEELKRK